MKKRDLWILLSALFAISAVAAPFTNKNMSLGEMASGMLGCAVLAALFAWMAKRANPDERFKSRPRRARAASASDYTAIDLETTGLSPQSDMILELGAVRVRNGKPVATYSQLVNPGRPIPPQVRKLTGITDDDVAGMPSIADALPKFLDFIGTDPLVGHNIIRFDSEFLRANVTRLGLVMPATTLLDTLPMAQTVLPSLQRHRLIDLVQYLHIGDTESHRAADDALQTAQVYETLKRFVKKQNIKLK